MSGANPLNIENVIDQSAQDIGYVEDVSVPLGAWTLGAGTTIAAAGAGIVGRAAAATSLGCIQWDDTADASDIVRLDWTLPGQFKSAQRAGIRQSPMLKLLVKARVLDGTGSATANANLALDAQLFFHNAAETALQTLSAVVTNVVGAADYAAAAEEGFAWYEYDLYAGMSAAQKLLALPMTTMQILLNPNETVGTNLYIEVIGTVIRYRRHASVEVAERN